VLPADIGHGCTGVPVVGAAVRALNANGTLHKPRARGWSATW
jgi:deoxyribodipyrimidine photolyase